MCPLGDSLMSRECQYAAENTLKNTKPHFKNYGQADKGDVWKRKFCKPCFIILDGRTGNSPRLKKRGSCGKCFFPEDQALMSDTAQRL
jgi:hypothetical protein